MYQFGWLSERGVGGNFFNLLQKEGVPRKGGFPQKTGGSNPGGNYAYSFSHQAFNLSVIYIKFWKQCIELLN